MAISHFIITAIPTSVIPKIGISVVQLNTLYDIALESSLTFERIPSLDGYYLSESVKFKSYDQSLLKYSNEAVMNIQWKEADGSVVPTSLSSDVLRLNDISESLISLISINSAVEFIEIISVEGVQNLKLNGTLILPGQRLSPKQMINATYTTNSEGGGDPYFTLTYKVGKNNIAEAVVYTLNISVDSLGEMVLLSQTSTQVIESFDINGIPTDYTVIREVIYVNINKGYQNGTAEINVVINSPFLTTAQPEIQSSVTLDINGVEIEKIANETFNVSLDLDDNGYGQLKITNEIIKDDATETGQIDLTLSSINLDPLLVSATNTVSITSSF